MNNESSHTDSPHWQRPFSQVRPLFQVPRFRTLTPQHPSMPLAGKDGERTLCCATSEVQLPVCTTYQNNMAEVRPETGTKSAIFWRNTMAFTRSEPLDTSSCFEETGSWVCPWTRTRERCLLAWPVLVVMMVAADAPPEVYAGGCDFVLSPLSH